MPTEPDPHFVFSTALAHHAADPFRLLVDSVKDYAIFMLDPALKIISWNPGAERIYGHQRGEILDQPIARLYRPEDVAAGQMKATHDAALRNGRHEEETVRVRKDGSHFWANGVLTALYEPGGRLRGFAEIVRDLTERRRWEQETSANEARLRTALDAGRMGSWWYRAATNQVFLDARLCELFGLPPRDSEMDLGAFLQFVHPEDLPALQEANRQIREGRDYDGEFRIVRPDGQICWMKGHGRVLRDERTGQVTQMVGVN